MVFGFTGNPKNGVATDKNWRKLEKDSKNSDFFDGYKLSTQKTFKTTGRRPDFFAYHEHNSRDRKVADAKCVRELNHNHVDQVRSYKGAPGYAKEGRIFVCKDTKVPHDVRQYAKDSNISIERRPVAREKGFFDKFFD